MKEILNELKDSLEIVASQVGFIEPGHGLKGKQHWISDEEDIETMYACFKGKREIVMWCLLTSPASASLVKKKSEKVIENENGPAPPPTKKSAIAQKINEVEDIIKELKEKHSTIYSIEQFSAWAHMIVQTCQLSLIASETPAFGGCLKLSLTTTKISLISSKPQANSSIASYTILMDCPASTSRCIANK